ncbi:hypothetical protein ACLVWU_06405 [Bdellovibrio sp. HCB290]|uniref:hypothetical protein n=1 Tax=Bdellovibrio sp. HCB290 TaxID=3394356 RepID=UPI0039B3A62A
MKMIVGALLLISSSAMAAGFYDRSTGVYTRAESYQELSWCDANKVVREASSGEIVTEADCSLSQKTCETDAMIFNKTVIYRAVCK